MKPTLVPSVLPLVALALTLGYSPAPAQEKVDSDQIQPIALKLLELPNVFKDAPINVAADASKGDALKHGDYGILVLPDKNLTAEALAKAGAEIIPAGQLWMKGVAPASSGKVLPNDQLRIITVSHDGLDVQLPLCLLGVHKLDGKLEWVLLGKDKTPLLHAALEEGESTQSLPISLSAEKEDEGVGRVTLNLLGKYQATFRVMLQDS